MFDPVTRSSERGNHAGDATASNALGAPENALNAITVKALGALDHAHGDTTPPATASNALGALAVAEQDILPAVG